MPSITIVVPDDTAQMRVDKFLSGQDEILAACGCANRSHLQNIITNLVAIVFIYIAKIVDINKIFG